METELFKWDKIYSVGHEEIDNQHRKLIEMINQAYNAIISDRSLQEAESLIDKMYDYTDYHFKMEENYFQKLNYPEKDTHIKEHKLFLKKIKTFKSDLKSADDEVITHIFTFLRDWLVKHILYVDKKYTILF
jgi:hemerythrin-like metal-binding protein